jgi:predicted dehydrogenase
MKKIRVGVVGLGQIAQIAHLPYLRELLGFEIGAVCEISEKVLTAIGDQYHIKERYLDYHDLVKQKDLDAVLITSHEHADISVAAMNEGKHVFVEKPMAFNLEQADKMVEAAKKNKVKLMVAYMKRYDPGYEYALPLFKSMKDIHLIRVHNFAGAFYMNTEIYDLFNPSDVLPDKSKSMQEKQRADIIAAIGKERADLVDAYSMLLYLCTHDAIVLHEAFGSPTDILHVDILKKRFVIAELAYGENTRCIWETGLVTDRPDWDEQITAYSGERTVEVRFPFPYIKNLPTIVEVRELEGKVNVVKTVEASFDEAFKREWRHFYECVTQNKEPITNGEKGRRDIAFMIDLIKAARL